MVFLITDGAQNPKKDRNGNVLDPVKSSQALIDRGIKIFAIGIGADLNEDDLVAIARSKDRVKTVTSAATLATDEFVRSLAEQTCIYGIRIFLSL